MLTIISATNNATSNTRIVVDFLLEVAKDKSAKHSLIDLAKIDAQHLLLRQYDENALDSSIISIQEEAVIGASHIVVVAPEYNGSFPGILKLFIDAISVRKYKETFAGKKILLVGLATGRAGNLRGIDHLTGIFHHLGSIVYPAQLPISSVGGLMEDDKLVDVPTRDMLRTNLEHFISF